MTWSSSQRELNNSPFRCYAWRAAAVVSAAARQVVVKKERKIMMEKDAKIYVAGHRGMVGSAIVRQLEKKKDITTLSQEHIKS